MERNTKTYSRTIPGEPLVGRLERHPSRGYQAVCCGTPTVAAELVRMHFSLLRFATPPHKFSPAQVQRLTQPPTRIYLIYRIVSEHYLCTSIRRCFSSLASSSSFSLAVSAAFFSYIIKKQDQPESNTSNTSKKLPTETNKRMYDTTYIAPACLPACPLPYSL